MISKKEREKEIERERKKERERAKSSIYMVYVQYVQCQILQIYMSRTLYFDYGIHFISRLIRQILYFFAQEK